MTATHPPKLTAEEATARVAKGAAWMDRKYPDWFLAIDLATFQVRIGHLCVWGQTGEHLVTQVQRERLGIGPNDGVFYGEVAEAYRHNLYEGWVVSHGFQVPDGNFEDYAMLQCAWVELIETRRAAKDAD